MKFFKSILFVFFSFSVFFSPTVSADMKYSYYEKNDQCFFKVNNQNILLAGIEEKGNYGYPCAHINSTYEINSDKDYLVSELLLAISLHHNNIYAGIIEKSKNNTFKRNPELSYLLSSCIPLKDGSNKKLINYLITNIKSYEKLCDVESGVIKVKGKLFLYDKVGENFKIQKSYLIKDDFFAITNYFIKNNEFWFFIDYNGKVKKWIPAKSIF